MNEPEQHEHPRGALALILIYLVTLVFLWVHVYLRLWERG